MSDFCVCISFYSRRDSQNTHDYNLSLFIRLRITFHRLMRLYIIVHVTAKDNNGFNRFDKYIYFFFRCGSKIAGRNGAKRRRTTRRICWDKKKAVALFPVSMDFSKARVLFVTKAPRPHRLFILIMEQTTGARELLVLATPPYSRAVTVWVTIHSAKYLHPAQCHRKYRGR